MRFERFSAHFPFSDATCPWGEQPSTRRHQIRQAKQREQLRRVFGQPPIARLAMMKQILHYVKRMFGRGTDAGLGLSSHSCASPSGDLSKARRLPGRIATCQGPLTSLYIVPFVANSTQADLGVSEVHQVFIALPGIGEIPYGQR